MSLPERLQFHVGVLIIDLVGAVVIVGYVLVALIALVRGRSVADARLLVAEGAVFGLSFKLAGPLLMTLELHTWEQILMFGTVLILRTILKSLFTWEKQRLRTGPIIPQEQFWIGVYSSTFYSPFGFLKPFDSAFNSSAIDFRIRIYQTIWRCHPPEAWLRTPQGELAMHTRLLDLSALLRQTEADEHVPTVGKGRWICESLRMQLLHDCFANRCGAGRVLASDEQTVFHHMGRESHPRLAVLGSSLLEFFLKVVWDRLLSTSLDLFVP